MKIKTLRSIGTIIAITAVVFTSGVLVGSKGVLADQFNRFGLAAIASSITPATPPDGIDFGPVWKAWNILDSRFVDAYATSTPESTDVSSDDTVVITQKYQDRVWGLISGLTNAMGDPYTVFLPPSESEVFNADISGSFEGVGMEITIRDQILTVVSPLKDTPAYNAGIKSGDKIVFIDDVTTQDMGVNQAVQRIRGKKGTTVEFGVVRDGVNEVLKIAVVRDNIEIPTIKTQQRADGIFVIELLNFSAKSANLFREAIAEYRASGDHSLIIDLRGNPGGYLDAAVDIASWFLPSGKVVVTEDYAGHGENRVHRSRGHEGVVDDQFKLVVLVDRGSASAAEILSGALKEHHAATVIGTRTFGKGSVQEVIPLTPDTSLKVTVARWLLAGDVFIAHDGIEPDIIVEFPEKDKFNPERDYILERAVEFLHSGK